jgi:hypothetical protein
MRVVSLWAFAAVSVLSTTVACSKEELPSQPAAEPVASTTQALPPAQGPVTREQRARELLRLANVQIRDLQDSRAAARDPSTASAIDREIVAVSHYRDEVLADLGGKQSSPWLEVDLSNLERAMQSAAVTAPQAAPPAMVQRRTQTRREFSPGGYLLIPPNR